MRRVISIILFVIGGWILTSGLMLAWMRVPGDEGAQLIVVGFVVLFSLPFLLLGTWASPGDRLRELGLTLLIAAGVGAALALCLMLFYNDPSFMKFMPPNQNSPHIGFSPLLGLPTVAFVAAFGWLLYRLRRFDKQP